MSKRMHIRWVVGFGLFYACSEPPAERARATAPDVNAATAAASAAGRERREPGDNPFGFASLPIDAKPGDYALVPSKGAIDGAWEHGAAEQTFVYLGAYLEQVGDKASLVRWLTRQRGRVANAFIVPIRRGERAQPGDVVLTTWASGSGLQRAIVVPGGTAESPKVRYLDLSLENTAARADESDSLPPNTFHVLRNAGESGTSLACQRGGRVEHIVAIRRSATQLLGLGFAGKMHVLSSDACVALPIAPNVAAGARVYVPHVGGFFSAQVDKVDAAIGRVHVRYPFAGEDRHAAVGFTNVALALPGRGGR